MPLSLFRVATFAANAIQLWVTWFFFKMGPEAGSGILMENPGISVVAQVLPWESRVAFGLLRIAPTDFHERPITSWWAAVLWGVMLAIPIVTWFGVWTAPSTADAHLRFTVGSWLWVSGSLAQIAIIGMGIAAIFACG